MSRNSRNPISWVPTVYFAMGLPFVVLNMVSVLMFKGLGIDDAQIALWTSLIMLPWTLKFLWSPFLEMFKTKKFFVVLTQLITGAGFALVALALHLPAFFAVCIALLAIIAFSGATHDVATDGVYMSELNKQDQAKYIGWQGAFYNIAKIVASGGLVWLAGWLLKHYGGVPGAEEIVRHEATVQAWMTVMFILAVVMVLLGVYHMRMLPSGGTAATGTTSGKETWNRLVEVIRNFFQKKHIWYYITFIILYRLAEGFVMKIVPLFLKAERSVGGLGLGEQEIGLYYGTYGAAAFVLGSLLAGYYISHRGLSRTLFSLCCIFNLPFLAYTLLAIYQPENGMLIGGAIVLEYFGYGFGFVGLSLFMMQQVAPGKHQMAHYAFASGIMNLGVMLPGSISGFVSNALGYKTFFIFTMFATIPAFLITYFDGVVTNTGMTEPVDEELKNLAVTAYDRVADKMKDLRVADALTEIFTLFKRCNKYIDETEPWVLAKDEAKKDRLATVLYNLTESILIGASLLEPYMPTTAKKIAVQFNTEIRSFEDLAEFGRYPSGSKVTETPEILFARLDQKAVSAKIEEMEAVKTAAAEKTEKEEKAEEGIDIEPKAEISYDDFAKLQFQVGEIIECKEVPKSKKLLCSQVKIGSQVKQIVSGIKQHYSAEEMVGKKVMVLVNLKPATLAGVVSEGMLLCAEDADGNLALMTPEKKMPAGAEIC